MDPRTVPITMTLRSLRSFQILQTFLNAISHITVQQLTINVADEYDNFTMVT